MKKILTMLLVVVSLTIAASSLILPVHSRWWEMFRGNPHRGATSYHDSYAPMASNLRWKTRLWDDVKSSPAVKYGAIYVGSGAAVHKLNASTGTVNWSYATGGNVESSPAWTSYAICVGSNDGYVYSIYHDGGLNWRFPTGDKVHSSPAVVYDRVYVGSDDGYVYCINALTGVELWTPRLQKR